MILFFNAFVNAQGIWTKQTNFGGTVRNNGIGFSIGTKGYLGTGYDLSPYASDFWEWSQSTHIWTQKADFGGGGRSYAIGFSIFNKGYVGTGSTVGSLKNIDFWEYDPATNIWTQKADFAGVPRTDAVGFSINGKGYLGTGTNGASVVYNDLWEYNPVGNTWTQKTNFPGTARSAAVGFSIGSVGYIGLGADASMNALNDFWEFDPPTNVWTSKTTFPDVGGPEAVGFSIGPKGYVGLCSGTSDFWEYYPTTNAWTQKTGFSGIAKSAGVGFSIGSMGYIGTGQQGSGLNTNEFWEYDRSKVPPSPTQSGFQKAYGNTNYDVAESGQQTIDGGFVLLGTTSYGTSACDILLVKTDSVGNLLWTKTFGDSGDEQGNFVQQTQDGGYIITGSIQNVGMSDKDVCIVKCDAVGNLQWTRMIGGSANDVGKCVQQTSDGGYVIAGTTNSFGGGLDDVYLIKFDSFGALLWTKTFGGSNNDRAYSIRQTNNGGLIIAGERDNPLSTDGYLIRTDANGVTLWEKAISAGANYQGYIFYSIQEVPDAGFICAGMNNIGQGPYACLVKTDSLGTALWSKAYGGVGTGHEEAGSVQQTKDGGYVFTGTTNSFGFYNAYLVKTNSLGGLLWSKAFGFFGTGESARFAQQINNGGFAVIGSRDSQSTGLDMYLIVTDSSGVSACNMTSANTYTYVPYKATINLSTQVFSGGSIGTPAMITGSWGFQTDICSTAVEAPEIQSKELSIQVSPNPNNGVFSVKCEKIISGINIYNLLGEKVYSTGLSATAITGVTINLSDKPSGVYFLRVTTSEGMVVRKIVKE